MGGRDEGWAARAFVLHDWIPVSTHALIPDFGLPHFGWWMQMLGCTPCAHTAFAVGIGGVMQAISVFCRHSSSNPVALHHCVVICTCHFSSNGMQCAEAACIRVSCLHAIAAAALLLLLLLV